MALLRLKTSVTEHHINTNFLFCLKKLLTETVKLLEKAYNELAKFHFKRVWTFLFEQEQRKSYIIFFNYQDIVNHEFILPISNRKERNVHHSHMSMEWNQKKTSSIMENEKRVLFFCGNVMCLKRPPCFSDLVPAEFLLVSYL